MLRPVRISITAAMLLACAKSVRVSCDDSNANVVAQVRPMSTGADCKVGDWKIIQDCGPTSTSQIAQRWVISPASGDGAACPALFEERPCTIVDCSVTGWGDWEACGADGYKYRTRTITSGPLNGGNRCPTLLDKKKCSEADCRVSQWTDWVCNADTGNAVRSREILRPSTGTGVACPSLQETKLCDPVDCQIKTAAEDTGAWGACQADTGYQIKVLGIKTEPQNGGEKCPPPTDQRRIAFQACKPQSVVVPAVSAPPLVPGNSTRNLTAVVEVLAYNDVYDMVQDVVNGLNVGGPSRVVPIAQQMRTKNPNSLVLFAGDTMSPSLWSLEFKGMQMVDAHNAIGVDFASLGNHDFDYGLEAFWNVTAASKFPWLNSNCYEKETGKLLRSTTERAIKEFNNPGFGKIKIGFFGVMYDLKDSSKGLYWTDPIEAAKAQVAALKAAGADMVVALTHQELADDNRLSKEVPGIHLIYGGHDHASMLQTNYGTPYLKADFNFRSVWRSRIEYFASDATIKVPTFRMEHTAVPVTQEMPSDKALDAIIKGYSTKFDALGARVVGNICKDLDITQSKVRTQDMPIGHVFTDALLAFNGPGSADAVVQNGGAIRLNAVQPAGSLTFAQLVKWSPFGNTVQIVQTDGASLKKFLTRELLPSCGDGLVVSNGLYVHTAGIKYTFTCTASKAGSVTSLEWTNHPSRTGTVGDTETFKLVMNDYLYANEFTVIPGVTYTTIIKAVEARRLDNALETYIKSQQDATLCENDATVRSLVVPSTKATL